MNYIYLLREREFLQSHQNIYKIGKTNRPILVRLWQYPKGSEIIFLKRVFDCSIVEAKILEIFCKCFTQRQDIGKEYFEGDPNDMMDKIQGIIYMLNKPIESNIIIESPDTTDESSESNDETNFKKIIFDLFAADKYVLQENVKNDSKTNKIFYLLCNLSKYIINKHKLDAYNDFTALFLQAVILPCIGHNQISYLAINGPIDDEKNLSFLYKCFIYSETNTDISNFASKNKIAVINKDMSTQTIFELLLPVLQSKITVEELNI